MERTRISVLEEKIELLIENNEKHYFSCLLNKLSENTFNFILQNFELIAVRKPTLLPTDKKTLAFHSGVASPRKDYPIKIDVNYKDNFDRNFKVPDFAIANCCILFTNSKKNYLAVVDHIGNLYCSDFTYYAHEEQDKAHIVLEKVIEAYKKIQFPIVSIAEQLFNERLKDLKRLTTNIELKIEVKKAKIDRKTILSTFKHELLSIETTLKTYYDSQLSIYRQRIENLEQELNMAKENAFSNVISILSRIVKAGLEITIDRDKLIIDCSPIEVEKIKRNNKIIEIPKDKRGIFKIGKIVVPYYAKKLKDCYMARDTAFHPNIGSAPCFGDMTDINLLFEGILLFKTINLDSAYDNDAKYKAIEIFDNIVKNDAPKEIVWNI